MNEIKNIVKNVLNEERKVRLKNAYSELNDIRDINFIVERYVSITDKLLNEGYDVNELEVPDALKNIDVKGALGSALMTSAKEYVINFVLLTVFKANPTLSKYASQIFADWNPLDLIQMFKSKENCNALFPKLSDRLITMLIRYITSNEVGHEDTKYGLDVASAVGTYSGNLFGEVIKDSDVSEKISNKFCELIF